MKKTYIVALASIALGIFFLVSTSADVSTYSNFDKAIKLGNRVKVVGQFSKDKPTMYNPDENANLFVFYMRDEEGVEKQVNYAGEKPQDFEMSEQIVVTGKMMDDIFYSDEMLMKCPSKYKGEEELINAQGNG